MSATPNAERVVDGVGHDRVVRNHTDREQTRALLDAGRRESTNRARTPLGRFLDKLDAQLPLFGCWEWRGARNSKGYGELRVGRRVVYAHRLAYELWVGPIPDGLVIDHLCRTRACVNPAHLEPVSNAENIRRGRVAREAS